MDSFRAVIGLWPHLRDFADDLGIPFPTAASMAHRDTIPAKYWLAVVNAAERRRREELENPEGERRFATPDGLPALTLDLLARLAARGTAGVEPAAMGA
jgi:hypothetical protein